MIPAIITSPARGAREAAADHIDRWLKERGPRGLNLTSAVRPLAMSVSIPYRREMSFEYGKLERLSPMIRRIIAHNPSAFTFHGTGTYVLGRVRWR